MTRARCLFSPVLAASLLFIASAAHALPDCSTLDITVPAGFAVKRCWTASALGVDRPIGGLRFNDAGTMLYVVGDAGTSTSKIHMVPVTRGGGPGTEVTDLLTQMGTPVAATSPSSTSGLDAGLEIGPTPSGTTAFVTYFGLDNEEAVTTIGERPGGISGPETKFTLRNPPTNLFQSPTGLTFSPFRTDPGTGLGHMQVSTSLGMIWEIGLTPSATPGIFNPGAKQLFVSVLPGGMEAIQYVPAGQFLGDLMYATRDDATVRRVEIDPATGLPLNTQGEPQQGTDTPLDFLFATGFSAGPIGLEFDAKTSDDLFVTTFDDAGSQTENKIYQIGGFSLGTPPTTTTVTTTTTTTTVSTSTTTSTTVTTTTSPTTLPTTSTTTSSTATTAVPTTTATTTGTLPPTTSSTTTTEPSSTTSSTTTTSTSTTAPTTTTVTLPTTSTSTTTTSTTVPTATSSTLTTTSTTTSSSTTSLPPSSTTSTSVTSSTQPVMTTTSTASTIRTTTSVTATTSSSITSPLSSTTSTTLQGSTPTTLPLPPVCAVSPTFASIECRLAVLAAEVDASGNLGRLEPGLLRTLARALKRTDRAESQVTAGHRRSARRALGAAIRNLVGFRSRLSSPAARRIVPPATRTELMGAADLLLADLRALRQGI